MQDQGPPIADRSAPGYVPEDDRGEEVAARLGVEILFEYVGGAHGNAYQLDGGRVLKVSHVASDAAMAALLLGRQREGLDTHPYPRIDSVHAFESSVEFQGSHYALRMYAVVREEAEDIDNGWPGGDDGPHWRHALDLVEKARRARRRRMPDLGLAAHCAPHVEAARDALAWTRRELGAEITDVRTANFGLVEGRLVIRDFQPYEMTPALLAALGTVPAIPERQAIAPVPAGP